MRESTRRLTHRRFARKVKQIVPVGTKGKMISLTAKNLSVERPTRSFNRLRRLALLTPIMRRPRADREEKRVTHANEMSANRGDPTGIA